MSSACARRTWPSLGDDWLIQVGYVGTTGVKLPRFIEGNPPVFVPGLSNSAAFCAPQSPPCPISTENNVNNRRLYSGCTLADPPSSCIYSSVGEIASGANSSYNALESQPAKALQPRAFFPCVLHVVALH